MICCGRGSGRSLRWWWHACRIRLARITQNKSPLRIARQKQAHKVIVRSDHGCQLTTLASQPRSTAPKRARTNASNARSRGLLTGFVMGIRQRRLEGATRVPSLKLVSWVASVASAIERSKGGDLVVDGSLSGCEIARARDRFGLAPEMHIMARKRAWQAWVPGRSSHRTTKTIREGAWECRIQLTGTAK